MPDDERLHERARRLDQQRVLRRVLQRRGRELIGVALSLELPRYLGVDEIQDVAAQPIGETRQVFTLVNLELPSLGVVDDLDARFPHVRKMQLQTRECVT